MSGLQRSRVIFTVCVLAAVAASWRLHGQAESQPPRVIETSPVHADAAVDPTLTEIRVKFDQPMNTDGGYSFVGGGPTFPQITGKPKWIDDRTIILPVRLGANHRYWLSINNPSFQNFRGANGRPSVPYPISFKTAESAESAAAAALTDQQVEQMIGNLRRAIDEDYSYRQRLGLDWDAVFAAHDESMRGASTAAEFAHAASKLLARAQDLHIWLKLDDFVIGTHGRSVEPNVNVQTLGRVVPDLRRASDAVLVGRFDDGIGYIFIGTWSRESEEALKAAFGALGDLKNSPGLIIDVRLNSGGDELLAQRFAGCFIEKPVTYARNTLRDPDQPGRFTRIYDRVVAPNADGPRYRGKVAVLMGKVNMSSCESFLMMMRGAPRCRLIGERSYGSSGNPRPHELGGGVTVYLPSWQDLQPDGTTLEGVGLPPDIEVTATAEELTQSDPILSRALEVVRQ